MSMGHRLLTGSLYTLFASLSVYVIAMVTTIIYARLLTPEEFGILGIFLTLGATIVPFTTLGTHTGVTKYVAEYRVKDPEKAGAFVRASLGLTVTIGLVVSVLYFLLADALAEFYGQPILGLMIRISALFLVLNGFIIVLQALVQGLQAIRTLAILNLVVQASGIPIVYLAVATLQLVGAAIGGVVFTALTLALSGHTVHRLLKGERFSLRGMRDRVVRRRLLGYSAPLVASMMLIRLALLFFASAVALWLTFTDLALYRVAASLERLALLLPGVLTIPLLPAVSEAYATQTRDRTRNQVTSLLRITMLLGLPLALLVGLGAPILIPLLYGPAYVEAAILLYVLSFVAFLETMNTVADTTLVGSGQTRYVLLLHFVQVVAIVVGSIVLIPRFGVLGAAFTMAFPAAGYLVGAYGHLLRNGEIAGRQVRDVATLAFVAFLASASLVLFFGLRDYPLSLALGGGVVLAEWLLLTPEDKRILQAALLRVLGRRPLPPPRG